MSVEKLEFAGFEVTLNSEFLRFDEMTLSEYIQNEAGYYDNFGAYLARAERNLQNKEMYHERMYSERFVEAKENGATEKMAEAKAKADPDVISAKQDIVDARYIANRLKQHLKAWDKSHDNAQSLGHMIRKQMDKLNGDIKISNPQHGIPGMDRIIEQTITPFVEKEFETNISVENFF